MSEVSFPAIIAKTSAMVLIMGVLVFALGMMSFKRHEYCQASGDFFYSDHFVISERISDTRFKIVNKLGKEQDILLCKGKMDWVPGVQVDDAKYEINNGCLDYSNRESYFSEVKDRAGNYILAKGY